ncbi:NBS-LRR type resistance protein [Cucumis melo var. makuwa]|uniref:NBS-LRR type resistance protein n=1 Tax=Cucumis melo var. makuwa TaxID=1194695 RepID=A0A5A7SWI4_CUCMM|nr:NBS-LRR type resistance protein [Cucumis melo var. makuwa]
MLVLLLNIKLILMVDFFTSSWYYLLPFQRKHKENQTRPYGLHASFLPLVGLPLAVPLPEKLKKRKERTYQSRDPEGCTYQSSDPERYTYQSSDPEGCTFQSSTSEGCTYKSSAPEGCTYQSSALEGCTYQSSAPEGYTYPLNRGSDWKRVLGLGWLETGATTNDDLRAFDDGDASRLGEVRRPALLQRGGGRLVVGRHDRTKDARRRPSA